MIMIHDQQEEQHSSSSTSRKKKGKQKVGSTSQSCHMSQGLLDQHFHDLEQGYKIRLDQPQHWDKIIKTTKR